MELDSSFKISGTVTSSDGHLDPEMETGNVEYKYTLIDAGHLVVESRASQMNFRLLEGNGLATLYLGVTDNGYQLGLIRESLEQSLTSLNKILKCIEAQITDRHVFVTRVPIEDSYKQLFLSYNPPQLGGDESGEMEDRPDLKSIGQRWKVRPIPDNEYLDQPRYVARIHISKTRSASRETRIAVLGPVDAGKSSLLGVLTRNMLDNGRGSARATVFKHPHEIDSGRTSAVSQQLLGIDARGKIVNKARMAQSDLIDQSSHLISLYDMAGHLKYLNTTMRGVCGNYPDHALIIVDGNKGELNPMTREHLILTYLHKIPMTVVITKIDMAQEQNIKNNMTTVKALLKSVNYQVVNVKSTAELEFVQRQTSLDVVPVILISNVTGKGIDLLVQHLQGIPKNHEFAKRIMDPFYCTVNETFTVPGVGTVISVLVIAGKSGDKTTHYIGPFSDGKFRKIIIRSIQNKRVNVDQCQADQMVTFAIRGVERREIQRGMVITDGKMPEPKGHRNYKAEITIIGRHSTSIREFYEPVIHIGNVRQAAKIVNISEIKRSNKPVSHSERSQINPDDERPDSNRVCLRSGDSAVVELEFKARPVHILPGSVLMFREQKVKGYGTILENGGLAVPGQPPAT